MRTTTVFPILFAVLALVAGPACAQAGVEEILRPGPAQPEKRPGQDREDDSKDDQDDDRKSDDGDGDEDLDEQVFYNGFGLGRAETEFVNLGGAVNLEGVMGFRIPTLPWFAVELDIAQTIIPGENEPVSPATPISNCSGLNQSLGLCTPGGSDPATFDGEDLSMQALGVSAAFKSTGRFYVTGRYGYRYLATSINELNDNSSSTGFGVGVGYRWGQGHSGVELAYKELAEGVESIGLTFYVRSMQR